MKVVVRAVVLVLLMGLVGCEPGAWGPVRTAVETSVKTNNAMVGALQEVDRALRDQRRRALDLVAELAKSRKEGLADIERVDERYTVVFDVLQRASELQLVLAEQLELARAAVDAGQFPDMPRLLGIYAELQSLYVRVMHLAAKE